MHSTPTFPIGPETRDTEGRVAGDVSDQGLACCGWRDHRRMGNPVLTPERVQAAVPGGGYCSRTAEGQSQALRTPTAPCPPYCPRWPGPTLEDAAEKTACGSGEGGLNLFCRTLADTICAEDMDAMLWRALSLETWSWGREGQVRAPRTWGPSFAGGLGASVPRSSLCPRPSRTHSKSN